MNRIANNHRHTDGGLYILYLLDRTDRLERYVFWRELLSTKGPFNMKPYREKLADKERTS